MIESFSMALQERASIDSRVQISRLPGKIERGAQRLVAAFIRRPADQAVSSHEQEAQVPTTYFFPSSDHFLPYYTPELFQALDPEIAQALQARIAGMLDKVHSSNVQTHSETSVPAQVESTHGEVLINSTRAATIASDHLMEILEGIKSKAEAQRTILVTSIDLILSEYFATDAITGIDFKSGKVKKDGKLSSIENFLAVYQEGDRFVLQGRRRKAEVRILPLPRDLDFVKPNFCLIGPQEDNLSQMLQNAAESGKPVVVKAKRIQRDLGVAYLRDFDPRRIVVTDSNSSFFKVIEAGRVRFTSQMPRLNRGLNFIVDCTEGNVDTFVRSGRNNLDAKKRGGILGIDVVQTGRSTSQTGLETKAIVMPVPCYPVRIQII